MVSDSKEFQTSKAKISGIQMNTRKVILRPIQAIHTVMCMWLQTGFGLVEAPGSFGMLVHSIKIHGPNPRRPESFTSSQYKMPVTPYCSGRKLYKNETQTNTQNQNGLLLRHWWNTDSNFVLFIGHLFVIFFVLCAEIRMASWNIHCRFIPGIFGFTMSFDDN
jgi:hypothetical protein